jgi:hypothetical protein
MQKEKERRKIKDEKIVFSEYGNQTNKWEKLVSYPF